MNLPGASRWKIWIDPTWFVEVDARGHALAPTIETEHSLIVQLSREGARGRRRALELPRLDADDARENSLRCQLVEARVAAAWELHELLAGDPASEVLAGPLGRPHPLRRAPIRRTAATVAGRGPSDEPRARSRVLVCFTPGQPPRLCSVTPRARVGEEPGDGADELEVVPPTLTGELARLRSAPLSGDASPRAPLAEAVAAGARVPGRAREPGVSDAPPWYLGLPSQMTIWPARRLRETAARRLHTTWTPRDVLALIRRVLVGVDALHSQGRVHGALAADALITSGAPTDPAGYRLASSPWLGSDAPLPDAELAALYRYARVAPLPDAARARGRLRTADAALILHNLDDAQAEHEYFICLGWRDSLLPTGVSAPGAPTLEATSLHATWRALQRAPESLPPVEDARPGDLLVLGSHVFEVINGAILDRADPLSSRARARHVCLRCRPAPARLTGGRYLVRARARATAEPPSGALLHIQGYRILPRQSAATDLRDIGELTLRALLSSAQDRSLGGVLDEDGREGADGLPDDDQELTADPERLAAGTLAALADETLARELWPRLDGVCSALRDQLARDVEVVDGELELQFAAGPQLPLRLHVRQLTKLLIETTPGARLLLRRVDSSAVFLLLIHFALACLQRRDALTSASSSRAPLRPFCAARDEPPTPDGCVAAALAWLDPLLPYLEPARARAVFEDFETAVDVLCEPAARSFTGLSPVYTLWSQLTRTRGKLTKNTHELLRRGSEQRENLERLDELERVYHEQLRLNESLEFRLSSHVERKRQFETELKRFERKLRDHGNEKRQLEAKLKASLTAARRLTTSYSDACNELKAWRERDRQLHAALQRLERIPLLNLRDQGAAREALYALIRATPRATPQPAGASSSSSSSSSSTRRRVANASSSSSSTRQRVVDSSSSSSTRQRVVDPSSSSSSTRQRVASPSPSASSSTRQRVASASASTSPIGQVKRDAAPAAKRAATPQPPPSPAQDHGKPPPPPPPPPPAKKSSARQPPPPPRRRAKR